MNSDDDLSEPLVRIVCAAIRHYNSRLVIAGARHYDDVMRGIILAVCGTREAADNLGYYSCEQGFTTNKGEFLTREQAWAIAEAAGQIRNPAVGPPGVLYSEMLY